MTTISNPELMQKIGLPEPEAPPAMPSHSEIPTLESGPAFAIGFNEHGQALAIRGDTYEPFDAIGLEFSKVIQEDDGTSTYLLRDQDGKPFFYRPTEDEHATFLQVLTQSQAPQPRPQPAALPAGITNGVTVHFLYQTHGALHPEDAARTAYAAASGIGALANGGLAVGTTPYPPQYTSFPAEADMAATAQAHSDTPPPAETEHYDTQELAEEAPHRALREAKPSLPFRFVRWHTRRAIGLFAASALAWGATPAAFNVGELAADHAPSWALWPVEHFPVLNRVVVLKSHDPYAYNTDMAHNFEMLKKGPSVYLNAWQNKKEGE